MKIKVVFDVEIALANENEVPTSESVANAMAEGFDWPAVVVQPGVEDGFQVWINSAEWSVVDEPAQELEA